MAVTDRRSTEITVGAWVVSGLALLIVFIFAIGDLGVFFRPGRIFDVIFDTAIGITEGAPVQYAGVEKGKVQQVDLRYDPELTNPRVAVTIWLPRNIKLRTDDQASISTFGLLGEKFLDIMPGSGVGEELPPGGELEGKPPVSTEQIMERSDEVLTEFKQALEGLNSLVGKPEARIYLEETLKEARDATRHWKVLGERLNVTLMRAESGEGNLGGFLYDDALYRNMVLMAEDLRKNPWKLLARPRRKTTTSE